MQGTVLLLFLERVCYVKQWLSFKAVVVLLKIRIIKVLWEITPSQFDNYGY